MEVFAVVKECSDSYYKDYTVVIVFKDLTTAREKCRELNEKQEEMYFIKIFDVI